MGITPSKQFVSDPSVRTSIKTEATTFNPLCVTAVVSNKHMLGHSASQSNPDNPDRLKVILQSFHLNFKDRFLYISSADPKKYIVPESTKRSGGLLLFDSNVAAKEHILLYHSAHYVNKVFDSIPSSPELPAVELTPTSSLSFGSKDALLHGVGSVLTAIDLVCRPDSGVLNAFCSVRPPGSHALQSKPVGCCIFNNIAIGVLYALQSYPSLKKVFIVDINISHSRPLQQLAEDNPQVSYCSIFQPGLFPNTGHKIDHPRILNYALSAKSQPRDFTQVLLSTITPFLLQQSPDVVFLAFGTIAHKNDPGSTAVFDTKELNFFTTQILSIASSYSQSRFISVLESGHHLKTLSEVIPEHIRVLLKGPLPS